MGKSKVLIRSSMNHIGDVNQFSSINHVCTYYLGNITSPFFWLEDWNQLKYISLPDHITNAMANLAMSRCLLWCQSFVGTYCQWFAMGLGLQWARAAGFGRYQATLSTGTGANCAMEKGPRFCCLGWNTPLFGRDITTVTHLFSAIYRGYSITSYLVGCRDDILGHMDSIDGRWWWRLLPPKSNMEPEHGHLEKNKIP